MENIKNGHLMVECH